MVSVKKITDKRNNPKGTEFMFYVSTSGYHGGCMFALKCSIHDTFLQVLYAFKNTFTVDYGFYLIMCLDHWPANYVS